MTPGTRGSSSWVRPGLASCSWSCCFCSRHSRGSCDASSVPRARRRLGDPGLAGSGVPDRVPSSCGAHRPSGIRSSPPPLPHRCRGALDRSGLADPRPGRAVPLLRPHGTAPAVHAGRRAAARGGDASMALARPAPTAERSAGVALPHTAPARHRAVQRRPAVHPLAGGGDPVGPLGDLALPPAHAPAGLGRRDVVAGGLPAAGDASVHASGPDAVPVRPVARSHDPGFVPDVRPRAALPGVRHVPAHLGHLGDDRSDDRGPDDEDRRRSHPVDGDHRRLLPLGAARPDGGLGRVAVAGRRRRDPRRDGTMSDHAPEPRERLLWPIVIPVAVLVVIGAILFLFSRVLLRVTPTAATITALVVAASILAVASVVASRPQVTGASLLSMVGGVTGIAMLTGGLALLLGQPTQEAQPVIVALTAPKGAATNGFQTKSLSAPAAYPFTIAFTNDDTGVQHNVVVAAQKTADPTGAIAAGQPVTGVGTVDVPVSPLTAGSYYFFCAFHPTTMFGTLTVAGPPPAPGAPTGPVITAQDLKFSPTTLDVPSGQPTTITFDNEDPGVLHNIQFFSDKDYTTSIYKGPDVTGVASAQYQLRALGPGTYYFHCDYHPTTMQGTITVAKSGGGSSPTGGSSSPSG